MRSRNQLKTMSDVLRFLMVQNKEYLLGQKGKPPIGKCLDCKRDVYPMEMCATCPNPDCGAGTKPICVYCVDKHDHLKVDEFLGALKLNSPLVN